MVSIVPGRWFSPEGRPLSPLARRTAQGGKVTTIEQKAASSESAKKPILTINSPIEEGKSFGTFEGWKTKLSELGSPGRELRTADGKVFTNYYDKDGKLVGGTVVYSEKDKISDGQLFIGSYNFSTKDIKGKITTIYDSKTGTLATDKSKDGIIDKSEIFCILPQKSIATE